jgi:hypothetical protein
VNSGKARPLDSRSYPIPYSSVIPSDAVLTASWSRRQGTAPLGFLSRPDRILFPWNSWFLRRNELVYLFICLFFFIRLLTDSSFTFVSSSDICSQPKIDNFLLLSSQRFLTISMELSPSWKAASWSATQEFLEFMELEGSLPCPQEPSRARRIQSKPPLPVSLTSILILSTFLRHGLHGGLFPSGIPTNIIYALRFFPFVLHALPISYSLTWSFWLYLMKNTSYGAPHYTVYSNLSSLHLSSVQIFSTPCSQTPSVYVPPLMWEAKFRTHTLITESVIK